MSLNFLQVQQKSLGTHIQFGFGYNYRYSLSGTL
jgi:hypothetical protein